MEVLKWLRTRMPPYIRYIKPGFSIPSNYINYVVSGIY